jgi:hypothetical protein
LPTPAKSPPNLCAFGSLSAILLRIKRSTRHKRNSRLASRVPVSMSLLTV